MIRFLFLFPFPILFSFSILSPSPYSSLRLSPFPPPDFFRSYNQCRFHYFLNAYPHRPYLFLWTTNFNEINFKRFMYLNFSNLYNETNNLTVLSKWFLLCFVVVVVVVVLLLFLLILFSVCFILFCQLFLCLFVFCLMFVWFICLFF